MATYPRDCTYSYRDEATLLEDYKAGTDTMKLDADYWDYICNQPYTTSLINVIVDDRLYGAAPPKNEGWTVYIHVGLDKDLEAGTKVIIQRDIVYRRTT